MIDFSLSPEEEQVRATVRDFITREVVPLEAQVLRNERAGLPGLERGQLQALQQKAKQAGFWGSTPRRSTAGSRSGR